MAYRITLDRADIAYQIANGVSESFFANGWTRSEIYDAANAAAADLNLAEYDLTFQQYPEDVVNNLNPEDVANLWPNIRSSYEQLVSYCTAVTEIALGR